MNTTSYTAQPIQRTKRVIKEKTPVRTPEDVYKCLKSKIDKRQEHFYVVSLDNTKKPIKIHDVFKGTVNKAVIHPRDIFREAIKDNASSIIIAHNHPGGTLCPSNEDLEITKRLKEIGFLIGIEIIDHIILTVKNGFFSFAGNGIF